MSEYSNKIIDVIIIKFLSLIYSQRECRILKDNLILRARGDFEGHNSLDLLTDIQLRTS